MRIVITIGLAAVLLAGCRGYGTAADDPFWEEAYYRDDPIPTVTNDGFYDGGVFDQDMIDLEPGQPDVM